MGKPMSTVYVPDEYGRLVPTQVPTWIGFIGWYAGLEPPEGYLYCDGSAIGRETYKELFDAIGTLYGAGDGSTTFNILDLRGLFVRGDGGNAAALGVEQSDAIRNIVGESSQYFGIGGNKNGAINVQSGLGPTNLAHGQGYGSLLILKFDASNAVPTAPENRPINMALKPCIRYV